MNKNYFSDITDLFLKVKTEENIQVDENAKAQIKQMLQEKISEMKHGSDPVRETFEAQDPKPSIWSAWRFQLLGVPASMFAVVLIVFAASNLNVSIPKEDFSPTPTQTQPIEEQKPEAFDRPLVKTAPGRLVVDFSQDADSTETRALNKIPKTTSSTTTQTVVTQPESTFETPKIEVNDEPVFVLDEPVVEAVEAVKAEETTPDVKENTTVKTGGGELPSTTVPKVEKIDNPLAEEIIPDSLDAEIPLDEPKKVEQVVPVEIVAEPIITTINAPVYTYRDEILKTQPAFTEEKLAKLTSSKTPESVTVYYVTDAQVVVEIEENGITKWYLFDNFDGTWTISKYEKYITESVVK